LEVIAMKLIRNAIALGMAVSAVSLAACSSQHGSATGEPGTGTEVGSINGERGNVGSVGMHLTIGNNLHVNSLNWTITNGTNSYTGVINITDDAGNEAQSIEFVAGGIQAGTGYTITLYGSDSNGDPCTGTSATVSVVAGTTSTASLVITCTVPTDASLATSVDSGNIAVDAGVVLVNQAPFVCPGITGVSISPSEILSPETAGLTAGVTGSSGGTQTLAWSTSCAGASITNPTSANATFACGSTPPGTLCGITLTVGLLGTAADGGSVGQVCGGVANTVETTNLSVFCEAGGLFQCFPPTPNLCGTNTCVNFQTDVNNCGTCGNVCGASTPACSAGVCIAQPPTACTTAPCASTGPNSVQCPGSAANNGVCTATEAAIVAKDIAKGNLTAGQLKPYVSAANNGSCYTCLNAKSCLDDNQMDVGSECADAPDLSGGAAGSGVTQCLSTFNCILNDDCQGAGGIAGTTATTAQENVNLCYCGGNNAGSACNTSGAATNGLCVTQEAAGFGFAFTDNMDILQNFGAKTFPSGIANHIFQCAASQKCTICQ
jgi:hypothetical protein